MNIARSGRPARFTTLSLAGLLVMLASSTAPATTVLKVDVWEMTALSEWVVEARVLAIGPNDRSAQGDRVYTDVTLAIDRVLAGEDVPKTYILSMMGGVRADGLAVHVPGMPKFKVGETVVLFLEKTGRGHVPCGLGQGVWRVTSPQPGERWVTQSSGHANLMKRSANGRIVAADHETPTHRRLETLVAEVTAARVLQTLVPAASTVAQ